MDLDLHRRDIHALQFGALAAILEPSRRLPLRLVLVRGHRVEVTLTYLQRLRV